MKGGLTYAGSKVVPDKQEQASDLGSTERLMG